MPSWIWWMRSRNGAINPKTLGSRSREKRGGEEKEEWKSILLPPYAHHPPLCCSSVASVWVLFYPNLLIFTCAFAMIYFSLCLRCLSVYSFLSSALHHPSLPFPHLLLLLFLPYRYLNHSLTPHLTSHFCTVFALKFYITTLAWLFILNSSHSKTH